jgi:hypothetical protein
MKTSIYKAINELESQTYFRQKLSLDKSIRVYQLNSTFLIPLSRELCTNIRDNIHCDLFLELIGESS